MKTPLFVCASLSIAALVAAAPVASAGTWGQGAAGAKLGANPTWGNAAVTAGSLAFTGFGYWVCSQVWAGAGLAVAGRPPGMVAAGILGVASAACYGGVLVSNHLATSALWSGPGYVTPAR